MTCISEPMAQEDDLLYMKDDYVWLVAAAGGLKKFVTVKIKRGRQNVLNNVQAAPGPHLTRCATLFQVNAFCCATYSLFVCLKGLCFVNFIHFFQLYLYISYMLP
ncbi:hypothetical protein AMTRI_Chr10g6210 [Amborella trichopoda]